MGSDTPKMGPDGLPRDEVPFYPASPEQMQTYRDAQEAVARLRATTSTLVHAGHPHEKLFIAAFDGTGNDRAKDGPRATNVARIYEQLEGMEKLGATQIHAKYLPGPGTQENPITRLLDGAFGYTSPDRVEDMYKTLTDWANDLHKVDPQAQIRVLSTGFSRGASQAAAFTNVLHERGIPDFRSKIKLPDGSFTYTRHLAAPGQIRQAVGLFDPVATGDLMSMDRRLPPSVESGFQISALDERRSLFPSDHLLPVGLSDGGRFLHVQVAGAHSDIGGGYLRNDLAIRNGNLMAAYCNGLCDRPLLKALPEPELPSPSVVHRSERGKLIFQFDRKVSRLQPEGINEHLAPQAIDPRLAAKGMRALGAAAVAYDALNTTHEAMQLHGQGNTAGMQSTVLHFGGRNLGMLAGAEIAGGVAALAGVETGPGALVLGAVGGVAGAMGGDYIASRVDQQRIYNQTDKGGLRWSYDPAQPEQGWTRAVSQLDAEAMRLNDGQPVYRQQTLVADAALSERLNYQASTVAVELAMAHPRAPQDPYRQVALPSDAPSVRDAPWTRDAQTHVWSRQVTDRVLEHGLTSAHTETASPARAALLDRAAGQTIADNLSQSARGIARQYQAGYEQYGWHQQGPMPEAVASALKAPENLLQASDGHTYAHGADGNWTTPGVLHLGTNVAAGNVRDELNATARAGQASLHPPAIATPAVQTAATDAVRQPSPADREWSATLKQIIAAAETGDVAALEQVSEAYVNSPQGRAFFAQADATAVQWEQQRERQAVRSQPRDPRDAGHPDHALNESIREQLKTMHCKAGIFPANSLIDPLTAAVALHARENRLTQVDHLQFNQEKSGILVTQAHRGKLDDLFAKHSFTPVQRALQTTPEQSYQQMAQVTQQQTQIDQAIQQQMNPSRQQGRSMGR